jgi:hypothetical protein
MGKLIFFIPIIIFFTCCSSGAEDKNPVPTGNNTVTMEIGSGGGQIQSQDGNLVLTVPAGSLKTDQKLSISSNSEPAGTISEAYVKAGTIYKFGPEGLQFDPYIQVKVKYDQGGMPENGVEEKLLAFYYINDDSTVTKVESTVDTANNEITASLPHFSFGGPLAIGIKVVTNMGDKANRNLVNSVSDAINDYMNGLTPEEQNQFYQDNKAVLEPFIQTATAVLGTDPISSSFPDLLQDITPPTISSTIPSANGDGVLIDSAISATFSEEMDVASIKTDTFTVSDGSADIAGSVSYNGLTAAFTPSGKLSYNTIYTATITTGAMDLAGNAVAANYTWTFTTGPDTTPPYVISTYPASDASGVAVNSTISVTFSEEMDVASITTSTFTVEDTIVKKKIVGTVTYEGYTASFKPSNSLPNGSFFATVTIGAKDLAGNAMASDYKWSFTTGTGK